MAHPCVGETQEGDKRARGALYQMKRKSQGEVAAGSDCIAIGRGEAARTAQKHASGHVSGETMRTRGSQRRTHKHATWPGFASDHDGVGKGRKGEVEWGMQPTECVFAKESEDGCQWFMLVWFVYVQGCVC